MNAVNTTRSEVFPYAFDNNTLYYSSDGHLGCGDLDIFITHKVNREWTEPANLKEPINSVGNDFPLYYESETQGYFASERPGGSGRDDIYQFVKIAGDDYDADRIAVNGVFEYGDLPPDGVQLRLIDENDNVISMVKTDGEGNFDANELPVDKEYRIQIVDATIDMQQNAEIYLVNQSGEKILILERMSETGFAFTTLPQDQIDGLSTFDIDDGEMGKYSIFGQLYDDLPYQLYSGITMVLEDDDGNIIQTVVTDSLGLYQFDNLPVTSHYKVKILGLTLSFT